MSYHFCQNKQKTADTPAPLFVKLKNELYSSTYWWLAGTWTVRLYMIPLADVLDAAGRPIPRHCEGFPEEAYQPKNINDEDSA